MSCFTAYNELLYNLSSKKKKKKIILIFFRHKNAKCRHYAFSKPFKYIEFKFQLNFL